MLVDDLRGAQPSRLLERLLEFGWMLRGPIHRTRIGQLIGSREVL